MTDDTDDMYRRNQKDNLPGNPQWNKCEIGEDEALKILFTFHLHFCATAPL